MRLGGTTPPQRKEAIVGSSGYIDWHRLDHTLPWVRHPQDYHTYVFAFWLVDYGRSTHDQGITLLKAEGGHTDWFLHADTADQVLAAYPHPRTLMSPNWHHVLDREGLAARPLLGSVLLGSIDACYRTMDKMWWADKNDLTWRGRRLLRQLDHLYERPAVLMTFIEGKATSDPAFRASDENNNPRGPVAS